ncbi:MAG: Tripartite ATP-independent periplasmic transporter [Smithella sp. PtaU1.Bin162]|nr:MAG: Tripartite ATP-independent periplasmic transporter [Smithella sp. PtaU1.Bin162]
MNIDIKQEHRNRSRRIINWFCESTGLIAGGFVIIMMLALIREVIGRYFFNSPTEWSVDLSEFLMVAMVYIGTAYTTSIDGHVRADFIYGQIKGKRKAYLDIFIDLASIFYVSIIFWEGWLLAKESFISGEVSSGGVRWPLFPFQFMVPIGAAMVILLLIVRLVHNIRFVLGKGDAYSFAKGGH